MEDIDYFDAVAGKIVGGAIRYLMLLALGCIATLTFLGASIATVASLRADATATPQLSELLSLAILIAAVLVVLALLRFLRLDILGAIRGAMGAIRGEIILSVVTLASIYILVFH